MVTLCFAGSSVPQNGAVTEIGFAEEKRCVYKAARYHVQSFTSR
jgi:hypothetical protein